MKELQIDEAFLSEYSDLISKYIWSKDLEGREEYDNIYNDVIIKLLESKDKYDSKRGAITTWITWVMRTVVFNYFRSKQVDALHNALPLLEAQTVSRGQDPASKEDLLSILMKADLSGAEKTVLRDFHYLGHTLEELSSLYGENLRTIQTRLNRARTRLTAQVQGELNGQ